MKSIVRYLAWGLAYGGCSKTACCLLKPCGIKAKSLDPDPGSLGLNPGSAVY